MTSRAPQPIHSQSLSGRWGSRAQSGPIAGCGTSAGQWGRSGARTRRLVFPAKLGGGAWRGCCTRVWELWDHRGETGVLGGCGPGVCRCLPLWAQQGGQALSRASWGSLAPR